jgi:uncharacterized protein YjbI with pentapeptide repeats
MFTTVGFSAFCLLALAAPDASILDAKAKVKIALLNIDIDYTTFLYIGPTLLIALTLYIHLLLEEWFQKLKPHTHVPGSADIYTMPPDIFHIQVPRLAEIIHNWLFYWIPIVVLICFALKWIPQQRNPLGSAFATFLSLIAIPVLIWIKIRRCPERQRLRKNLLGWAALGLIPLYLALWPYVPRDIRSGMQLYGVDFHRQDLAGIVLPRADLRKANLQDTNLQGANLREVDLRGANLQGANLQEADLREAKLQGANLRGAKLCGADLHKATLTEAILKGADLRATDLPETILEMSGEPLTTYSVQQTCPPSLSSEANDDSPGALLRMVRDYRAQRAYAACQKAICETPLPVRLKADKNLLNDWVAYARTQFETPYLAKDMLDLALKIEKDHFGTVFQLGRWLHIQAAKAKANGKGDPGWLGLHAQAIEQYTKALRLAEQGTADGTSMEALKADVYYNLGHVYIMNQDYESAIAVLTKWQALSAVSDDKVLTNLAISHLNKTKPDKGIARSLLKQAVEMNPNNAVAKNELKGLETR